MARRARTLLAPGHQDEWARINDEERQRAQPPAVTPVATLLQHGIALSAQAITLLNAIEHADGPGSAASA